MQQWSSVVLRRALQAERLAQNVLRKSREQREGVKASYGRAKVTGAGNPARLAPWNEFVTNEPWGNCVKTK